MQVTVTQQDYDAAAKAFQSRGRMFTRDCPNAQAIRRAFGISRAEVDVGTQTICIGTHEGLLPRRGWMIPTAALAVIDHFGDGKDTYTNVEDVTYELKGTADATDNS